MPLQIALPGERSKAYKACRTEQYNESFQDRKSYHVLFLVLSREPSMSDEVYKMLLDIATKEGYDVSTLVKTEHKDGVGEASTDTAKTDSGYWWLKALFGK
ncbi:hypothetical protein CBR_g19158 [Chara braunii]|uniref:Lipocalin/cytosolic fatty-acid binding domain-containing protein n=1 Tax=Chara braunii TaxID=69332 RepID=A0A388JTQ2_CHABU|nr:hypothetical protein CBR_g19158 [Chara braunii]|eukprot:GBG61082.1 hypothetical protein CBR_g19158 [Chara braunii]